MCRSHLLPVQIVSHLWVCGLVGLGYGEGMGPTACGKWGSWFSACVEGSSHPCTEGHPPPPPIKGICIWKPHMVISVYLNIIIKYCISFYPLQVENKPNEGVKIYSWTTYCSIVANYFWVEIKFVCMTAVLNKTLNDKIVPHCFTKPNCKDLPRKPSSPPGHRDRGRGGGQGPEDSA